jgi:hypothetical protein
MGGKKSAKSVGITKDVHVHSLHIPICHTFTRRRYGHYHAQRSFGHQNIETTRIFTTAQLESQQNSVRLTRFCAMQPEG